MKNNFKHKVANLHIILTEGESEAQGTPLPNDAAVQTNYRAY